MLVTLLGIVTLFSSRQLLKALPLIFVTVLGIIILVIPIHSKVDCPILLTSLGISNVSSSFICFKSELLTFLIYL